MAILIKDSFDGMTLGTTVNGRVPETTESGFAWKVELANGTANSDGQGRVQFSAAGASLQQRTLAESDVAIQVRWLDGGSSNGAVLYIGDTVSSTIYPRNAYGAMFMPRSGTVRMLRFTTFEMFAIGTDITGLTFNFTNDILAFQRKGNDFEARLNGVYVGEFTDATYAPNGSRRHHGLIPSPFTNNAGRLIDFEILDTLGVAGQPAENAFTIVELI